MEPTEQHQLPLHTTRRGEVGMVAVVGLLVVVGVGGVVVMTQ